LGYITNRLYTLGTCDEHRLDQSVSQLDERKLLRWEYLLSGMLWFN